MRAHVSAMLRDISLQVFVSSGLLASAVRCASCPVALWRCLAQCCACAAEPLVEIRVEQRGCSTCLFLACAWTLRSCIRVCICACCVAGKAASLVTLLTDLPVIASVSDAGSGAVCRSARWLSLRFALRWHLCVLEDGRVFISVPRPSRVYR